jgi:hypothetical protein
MKATAALVLYGFACIWWLCVFAYEVRDNEEICSDCRGSLWNSMLAVGMVVLLAALWPIVVVAALVLSFKRRNG